MTVRMKAEIRDRWADALESGKYAQVKGVLAAVHEETREPIGFCCLGVLCELAAADGVLTPFVLNEPDEGNYSVVKQYGDSYTGLPEKVIAWAGIVDDAVNLAPVTDLRLVGADVDGYVAEHTAAAWNDDMDATFADIAAMVRNIEAVEA